ncbi:hypothetical protein [Halomonas binhaiensis]|uniref:Alpha/beta hydrolase n=1 Tax=Halomonas binhaiensis TaxID=2562282 RepID=A0A5C1NK40_9GAMM|nr:hypothetical protein [Halomonas binhaiensis]QEM82169.1 hypothetical protein E4T21_11890 [Halomonas binhaiensis]
MEDIQTFFNSVGQGYGAGRVIIDDVFCQYNIHDLSKPLVYTFSNMGQVTTLENATDKDYSAWGYSFINKQGLNVIAFSCLEKPSWFRSDIFHDFIVQLSALTGNYVERLGYGGSMGGYAVAAFANQLQMDRILVMNPISTLNEELAPFETRFKPHRRRYNWSNSFHDGATASVPGYIIYDPLFELDKKHATRFDTLCHLKLPGVGHGIPRHLHNIGSLKWIVQRFIRGAINEHKFYTRARKRRNYPGYYNWMLSKQNIHLTNKRRHIIMLHKKANRIISGISREIPHEEIKRIIHAAERISHEMPEESLNLFSIVNKIKPNDPLVKRRIAQVKAKSIPSR